jgi:hypothetical protein
MSKDLPYFRFYPSEWFEGEISLHDMQTQGLFTNICGWYWKKDSNITISEIRLRLIKGQAPLEQSLNNLIKAKIIKPTNEDYFSIDFLDEQYSTLRREHENKVKSGRAGGQASVKQRSSNAQGIDRLKIDNYKDILKKEGEHLNSLMITFKINEIELFKLLDKFDLMNSQHENYLDFRDHFGSWLNKQDLKVNGKPSRTMEEVEKEIEELDKQRKLKVK